MSLSLFLFAPSFPLQSKCVSSFDLNGSQSIAWYRLKRWKKKNAQKQYSYKCLYILLVPRNWCFNNAVDIPVCWHHINFYSSINLHFHCLQRSPLMRYLPFYAMVHLKCQAIFIFLPWQELKMMKFLFRIFAHFLNVEFYDVSDFKFRTVEYEWRI